MRKNTLSLAVMMGLFVLVAGVAYALNQQEPPPPPPQQQTTPPATPPAETRPPEAKPADEDSAAEPDDPNAPRRFVPTQKTSADNNATFPVDI